MPLINSPPYVYDKAQMESFNPFDAYPPDSFKHPKDMFKGFISSTVVAPNSLKSPGVYILHHPDSDLSYIGGTGNLNERFLTHLKELRNNYHHNKALQEAYNTSPWINFYFKPAPSKAHAHDFEREVLDNYWGKEYVVNTNKDPFGPRGTKLPAATIAKMVATRNTPEMKQRSSELSKGRKASDETRKKISASLMGHKTSDRNKQITSALFKGKPRSEKDILTMRQVANDKVDAVSCDGAIFSSAQEASRRLGIAKSTILFRIHSKNNPNWFRVSKDSLTTIPQPTVKDSNENRTE